MNKLFKKIAAAIVGMAMAVGVGVAVGHSAVHEAKAAESGPDSSGYYSDTFAAGTFDTDHITWSMASGNVTMTQRQGTSGTAVNSSYATAARVYKGHYLAFVATNGYKINRIEITVATTYYGNSMTVGTAISENVVTDNTTAVSRTWTTTSGGKHIIESVSSGGLDTIYLQNVATASNVQLRWNSGGVKVFYTKPNVGGPTSISCEAKTIEVIESVNLTTSTSFQPGGASSSLSFAIKSGSDYIDLDTTTGVVIGKKGGSAVVTITPQDTSAGATAIDVPITVTSIAAPGLNVGDKYAIYAIDEANSYQCELTGVSSGNVGTVSEISNGTPSFDYLWTIGEGYFENTVTFKNGDDYLALTADSNNLFAIDSVNANSSWKISWNENVPTITSGAYPARNLKFNPNKSNNVLNPRFACYSSAQVDVLLAKYTAPAPKVLDSIILSGTQPTNFFVGDQFSATGLVVTAHYTDAITYPNEVIDLADCEFSGYDMTSSGEQTVTVTYGGKTAQYTINVTAVAPASMTVSYTGGTVETGNSLDSSKVDVTITNNNGSDYDFQMSELEFHLGTVDGTQVPPTQPFAQAGTYTIFVVLTAYPQVNASFEVTVVDALVPATGVVLEPHTLALVLGGEDGEVDAAVTPLNTTDQLEWSVAPAGVIELSNSPTAAGDKVVHALAAGTATITATAGSFHDECVVTVTEPAPKTFTVSFDAGQGSGTMTALTKQENSVIQEAPECTFDAPEGQVFDKWVDQTGAPIEFPYTVTGNVTFYASYKAAPQPAQTVIDTLNQTLIGNTPDMSDGNNDNENVHYEDWSGKSDKSSAVYSGNSRGGWKGATIQLRSNNNNSGIVSTTSGGKLKSVTIKFNVKTETTSDRFVSVYGNNTAYTAASDLYNSSKQGTLIQDVKFDKTNMTVKVDVTDTYQFVGLRSKSGAVYLDSVEIEWESSTGPIVINPTGVVLDKTSAQIEVGSTTTIAASLTPNGAEGTITWASDNEAVATVTSAGVVTGVSAGTAHITASCGTLSASCTVEVVAAGAKKGTESNPFTPAEANAECAKYTSASTEEFYVAGIVSRIGTEYSSQYENISFYISVDGATTSEEFYVYRCKGSEGIDASTLAVGDTVVVKGKLQTYTPSQGGDSIPEMCAGCIITSLVKGQGGQGGEGGQGGGEGGQGGGEVTPPTGKTLQYIEVVGPTKSEYFIGDTPDYTGLKVILHYTDGTTFEITDLSKIGALSVDMSKPGDKVVTVTYDNMTATFVIKVTRNPDVHDGCHCSILAGSALLSITTLIGAGLLLARKRKED